MRNGPELAKLLARRGIRDTRVLAAMAAVPREQFVPEAQRRQAYADRALSIGHGQTISQPFMVASMLEPLGLDGGRLLDVGSGNGSPGVVLAALRPDVAVTLLEPRQRRWAFLREAIRAIGRPEIDVRRERLEAYGGDAENVTLRALVQPGAVIARHLAPGPEPSWTC